MIYFTFLLTAYLAEVSCTEVKEQGGNGAALLMQQNTKNANSAVQAVPEWLLDCNLRKPGHCKLSEVPSATKGNEWWYQYASKSHFNRSGNIELRARRVVREAPASVRSYLHLGALILDLMTALRLNFLQVYTNESPSGKYPTEKFRKYNSGAIRLG